MSIPSEVSYDRLPPIGYPNTIKITQFLPSTNQIAQPGDIVRFNINTPGFWDPYTAYIKLEVDISQETALDLHDVLQIDSSAASFISELVITCKGGELERITEYDVLANFLNDVSLNNEQRQCRDIEGLGHNSRAFNKRVGAVYPDSMFTSGKKQVASNGTIAKHYEIETGKANFIGPKPWFMPDYKNEWGVILPTALVENTVETIESLPGITTNWLAKRYNASYSYSSGQAYTDDTATNTGYGGMCYNLLHNLNTSFSTNDFNILLNRDGGPTNMDLISHGITNIFNNNFTQGCFEPQFTNGTAIGTMLDGRYQPVIPQKRTFCIPLLSGVLGSLMPKASYKYVPMLALEDLVLEFRLNPYAMFTSGYKPYKNGAWVATGEETNKYGQIPRKWKITKFEINVEMLHFDKTIDNIVLSALNTEQGINFHTVSWYLGPQFSLPPQTTPQGTYQLNLGFESLKTLVMMFIPQDYLKYSFLRKLFRVNCGITSIQLRIGMELYPSLPLKGHAGTSAHYPSSYLYGNNAEYLISLQKAFQKFHNKDEDCAINCENFAVNRRNWSPATSTTWNSTTFSDVHDFNCMSYMPLIHENRCVGKAAFCLDLESMSENPRIISGLNTLRNKNFEILLTSDTNGFYFSGKESAKVTENVVMYFWCQYDMVVQLKKYGIKILGKGSSI